MSALRHREFRMLWAGQAVSAVGDQLNVVALAIFALEHGYGATGLGMILATRSVALVLFLIAGGIVGDRRSRRAVMLGADVLRGAAILAVALTPAGAPLLVIAGLAFLVGAGEAFFQPAYGALMPTIVPAPDLISANSLTSIARQTSSVLGPALAGVLIAVVGVRLALVVDAATFAVSAATLAFVREPARPARVAASALREVREGFAAVWARPWLAAIIGMAMIQILFVIGPWEVLLPVISREHLGGNGAFAFLISIYAAGALAGAIVSLRIRTRRPGVVALLALLPWPVFFVLLVGPAPLVLIAVAAFAAGVGEQIFEVLWITAQQRDVPGELLARVVSLDYLGSFALMPIGLALAGPATERFGADAVLVVGAAVALVTTLPLLAFSSVRRLSSRPEPEPEPEPAA
jgi:MFS family permease